MQILFPQADSNSERIVAIGRHTTSDPSKFEEISRVKFEVENKINLRSMLDHDLEA
jgi:DNA-binding ferritin-like protein